MSDRSNSFSGSDMSDLSNSPSQSDMSDYSNSSYESGSPLHVVLALPAIRHIPEALRPRMFPGRNAAVQDSEEVTSNVLDNGPVIDAVPISFAYIPEGSPSRGRCDICGRGGGRCEDQGTNTSSENDDTENPSIQAQPASTNLVDDDDDATDATGEHHK